ncbi:tRNA1(Val) (adenine(37)-N6)-methyltransferase [Pedobacter sp.]|uniref:tRNA1(Val) (adenine(37)-N6)-methyltransferase n=1 Tax=Pedobacter sp. TaxID=1411316 RepID=UPI003D7F2301
MGSIFKFKQFEVDQTDCAMKINTDGVLLGAVAGHPAPQRILDIGTGTGVIAMMLAQRYLEAFVDAVEIDRPAAIRAATNFKQSLFADRLMVNWVDIASFKTDARFELIVSNPPYFVNDLKNPEARKGIARHTDEDFFNILLLKVAQLLADDGVFWVILPVKQAGQLIVNAVLQRLFPSKIIHVYSDAGKTEFRQIVCFSFQSVSIIHENFYIYQTEGLYTNAYATLLKDYFLAF